MPGTDGALYVIPPLIREKLAAFDQIEPAFRASFGYVEQMHGEARFPSVPVAGVVRYLHALFLCHCKDALLSIPTTTTRYDRRSALDLLEGWQNGATPPVVAFLEAKLTLPPFADLFRQLAETETTGDQPTDERIDGRMDGRMDERGARRLRHGLGRLLNRAHNLHAALDTLAGLPRAAVIDEVRGACVEFGHTPDEIRQQREWLATPLYSYVPHAEVARRNMLLMNSLGVQVTTDPVDRPGERTARVLPGDQPLPPYAATPIAHETQFTPPFSTPPYFPPQTPPPVADEGPEQIVANEP